MILDSNFNIKQDNKITFLNVHLRQPPFSSLPKGLKDPSVGGGRRIERFSVHI